MYIILILLIILIIYWLEYSKNNICCYQFCSYDNKCKYTLPRFLVDQYIFDKFMAMYNLIYYNII